MSDFVKHWNKNNLRPGMVIAINSYETTFQIGTTVEKKHSKINKKYHLIDLYSGSIILNENSVEDLGKAFYKKFPKSSIYEVWKNIVEFGYEF